MFIAAHFFIERAKIFLRGGEELFEAFNCEIDLLKIINAVIRMHNALEIKMQTVGRGGLYGEDRLCA